jgi:TetR/AcrR family transcriptional repressor of nem operon
MTNDAKQVRRQMSHERILDAAARAVCRDGYAGVGVAHVMKEAGLTHGGFYAHFASRDALLAQALEHAGKRSIGRLRERLRAGAADGVSPLRALIEVYLSEAHTQDLDNGCPVAALGADLRRGEPELRVMAARRVQQLADVVREALGPGMPAGAALVVASTLVGAIQMARVLDGEQRAAVLHNCRDTLIAQYDRTASADR